MANGEEAWEVLHMYSEKHLHREAFKHSRLSYTASMYTQKLLFIYTQKLWPAGLPKAIPVHSTYLDISTNYYNIYIYTYIPVYVYII